MLGKTQMPMSDQPNKLKPWTYQREQPLKMNLSNNNQGKKKTKTKSKLSPVTPNICLIIIIFSKSRVSYQISVICLVNYLKTWPIKYKIKR